MNSSGICVGCMAGSATLAEEKALVDILEEFHSFDPNLDLSDINTENFQMLTTII